MMGPGSAQVFTACDKTTKQSTPMEPETSLAYFSLRQHRCSSPLRESALPVGIQGFDMDAGGSCPSGTGCCVEA